MKDTNTILQAIWQARNTAEWWRTDKPNVYVVGLDDVDEGMVSYRVTVEPVPTSSISPSEWAEGKGPHPYGWEAANVPSN